jgi:putative colanic acid biosynthesis UDP-glucose lipid carrier transferase
MQVSANGTATAVTIDLPPNGADVLTKPMGAAGLLYQEAASTQSGPLQANSSSPVVLDCVERSWDDARSFETGYQSSLQFENAWRWPLSYRSIESVAIIIDILIILSSGVVAASAYHLTMTEFSGSLTQYVGVAAVIAALFTSRLKERGLYKPTALLAWTDQVRTVTITWIGVFLFLAGCVFALKIGSTFSRGTFVCFATIGLCGLIAHRTVWRTALEKWLASGRIAGRRVVLITEDESVAGGISEAILRHGFRVQRHFVLSSDRSLQLHLHDAISKVISYARRSNVDEVFIAADLRNWDKLREPIERLRLLPLPVQLIAVGPASELLRRPLSAIGNCMAAELQRAPLNCVEIVIKRVVDVIAAGIALVLLMPVFVLVAIAIKLDSPGPVLFNQMRHGFNGNPFQILKFRTMTVLEDGDAVKQAERFDKRVTRVGSWLRRTSIDELPQLVNVLEGDMSIVGPRPHAVAHDTHFDKLIADYACRQRMKPGITGCAQVNGCRGETPTVEAMRRRVEFDIWYIDNWSFYLDCTILLRTVIEVIRGRNAY